MVGFADVSKVTYGAVKCAGKMKDDTKKKRARNRLGGWRTDNEKKEGEETVVLCSNTRMGDKEYYARENWEKTGDQKKNPTQLFFSFIFLGYI